LERSRTNQYLIGHFIPTSHQISKISYLRHITCDPDNLMLIAGRASSADRGVNPTVGPGLSDIRISSRTYHGVCLHTTASPRVIGSNPSKRSTWHDWSHLVGLENAPILHSRLEVIGLDIPKTAMLTQDSDTYGVVSPTQKMLCHTDS